MAGLFSLLALAAIACGDDATSIPVDTANQTPVIQIVTATPDPAQEGARLGLVKSRGKLICAGRTASS